MIFTVRATRTRVHITGVSACKTMRDNVTKGYVPGVSPAHIGTMRTVEAALKFAREWSAHWHRPMCRTCERGAVAKAKG